MPEMVSVPSSLSVQVRFSPQVPLVAATVSASSSTGGTVTSGAVPDAVAKTVAGTCPKIRHSTSSIANNRFIFRPPFLEKLPFSYIFINISSLFMKINGSKW